MELLVQELEVKITGEDVRPRLCAHLLLSQRCRADRCAARMQKKPLRKAELINAINNA